jgi:hypothetical protein
MADQLYSKDDEALLGLYDQYGFNIPMDLSRYERRRLKLLVSKKRKPQPKIAVVLNENFRSK